MAVGAAAPGLSRRNLLRVPTSVRIRAGEIVYDGSAADVTPQVLEQIYDGKLAVQSESAMKGIRIMFYYAPLVVFIAILALLFFYKLDREYDGIMKVLDERHKKQEEAAA